MLPNCRVPWRPREWYWVSSAPVQSQDLRAFRVCLWYRSLCTGSRPAVLGWEQNHLGPVAQRWLSVHLKGDDEAEQESSTPASSVQLCWGCNRHRHCDNAARSPPTPTHDLHAQKSLRIMKSSSVRQTLRIIINFNTSAWKFHLEEWADWSFEMCFSSSAKNRDDNDNRFKYVPK